MFGLIVLATFIEGIIILKIEWKWFKPRRRKRDNICNLNDKQPFISVFVVLVPWPVAIALNEWNCTHDDDKKNNNGMSSNIPVKHDFESSTYNTKTWTHLYIYIRFFCCCCIQLNFQTTVTFEFDWKEKKNWRSRTFYCQSDANKSIRMRLRFIDLLKHFQLFIHGFFSIRNYTSKSNNNEWTTTATAAERKFMGFVYIYIYVQRSSFYSSTFFSHFI